MSRVGHEPDDEVSNRQTCYLPDGLIVPERMNDGGDSLFESLMYCLKDLRDVSSLSYEIPDNDVKLRRALVHRVLLKPERYGIPKTKENRKSLSIMRYKGQMQREELL